MYGEVAGDWEATAAVAAVRTRMAAAAERVGRDPTSVRLVAVGKGVEVQRLTAVVAVGVRDIGENLVREAERKRAALPEGTRLHLIGHLQSNKAGRAARLFDVVHSLDRERVALALASRRPADLADLDVLVEVDFTGIVGRTGVAPNEVEGLIRRVAELPRLRLRGLMAIAPPGPDAEAARPTFAALRRLRDALEQSCGLALPELSMGMSDDFEVAIEEGATMIRVGRALFGGRSLPG